MDQDKFVLLNPTRFSNLADPDLAQYFVRDVFYGEVVEDLGYMTQRYIAMEVSVF